MLKVLIDIESKIASYTKVISVELSCAARVMLELTAQRQRTAKRDKTTA
jgi:hypothetical protein